jgi:hypothetical protein
MADAGLECRDCHGEMSAVAGNLPLLSGGSIDGTNDGGRRRPWIDLPRCQSCHTGDAVSHLAGAGYVPAPDGFRLAQAWKTGDGSASPISRPASRFAENTNASFQASRGHGGLLCQSCHGSTHAEWPVGDPTANDNVAAVQLQGHRGAILECVTCHAAGTLGLTTNGPHGLHNVNDSRWVDENHGSYYERNPSSCQACHGTDLRGTPLSRTPVARTFHVEDGTVTLPAGTAVGCTHCHGWPAGD